MTQAERRVYLLTHLLRENHKLNSTVIPEQEYEQRKLLRSLMNVRQPKPLDEAFLEIQDEYLRERNQERGIVTLQDMDEVQPGIYLWQGDITQLKVDAIVNAANSGLTGCYIPCHACIDNCIHTYAGLQLRDYCNALMEEQAFAEPTGQAKVTPAFNLPAKYILHTVGPIVQGKVTPRHEEELRSCYRSCLRLAARKGAQSIALCCISTGMFMFPNERAAEIAVETVQEFRKNYSQMKVVFNVYLDEDLEIYKNLLAKE